MLLYQTFQNQKLCYTTIVARFGTWKFCAASRWNELWSTTSMRGVNTASRFSFSRCSSGRSQSALTSQCASRNTSAEPRAARAPRMRASIRPWLRTVPLLHLRQAEARPGRAASVTLLQLAITFQSRSWFHDYPVSKCIHL